MPRWLFWAGVVAAAWVVIALFKPLEAVVGLGAVLFVAVTIVGPWVLIGWGLYWLWTRKIRPWLDDDDTGATQVQARGDTAQRVWERTRRGAARFTLWLGAQGLDEWAEMSPRDRREWLDEATQPWTVEDLPQCRVEGRLAGTVEQAAGWLHRPHLLDERHAELDGQKFRWIVGPDGSRRGYEVQEVNDGAPICQTVEFGEIDSRNRPVTFQTRVTYDGELNIVMDETLTEFREGGVMGICEGMLASGLQFAITYGCLAIERDDGSTTALATAAGTAQWPAEADADLNRQLAHELGEELTQSLLEQLQQVMSAVAGRGGSTTGARRDVDGDMAAAFAVLGLEAGATSAEARQAYRQMALLLHPDRHRHADTATQDAAHAQMSRLNDAYAKVRGHVDTSG